MISRRDAETQRMTEDDIETNDILCVFASLRGKIPKLKWGSYLITVP
jgi:hypothetical protein